MMSRAQYRSLHTDEKRHVKLYKSGKLWLAAGISLLALTGVATSANASVAPQWHANSVATVKAELAKLGTDPYTIQNGDTLWAISQATGVSVNDLANQNKIANVDLIYVGNHLFVHTNVDGSKQVTVTDANGATIGRFNTPTQAPAANVQTPSTMPSASTQPSVGTTQQPEAITDANHSGEMGASYFKPGTPDNSQAASDAGSVTSQAPSDAGSVTSQAPSDASQTPSQAPSDASQTPSQAASDASQTPSQAPSDTSQTPSQAPSDTSQTPSQAPSDASQAPSQAPSDASQTPSQAPSDASQTPSQAPSDASTAPSQAPSDASQTPSQAPSGASQTPSQAPSDASQTPSQAPSDASTAPSQAPSDASQTPSQSPSNASTAPSNAGSTSSEAGSSTSQAPAEQYADVTVSYTDMDGNTIAPSTTLAHQLVGSTVSASAQVINGYDYYGSTKYLTVAESGNSIVFHYSKQAPVAQYDDVIVEYLDADGNLLTQPTTMAHQQVGSTLTVSPITIDGYTPRDQSKSWTVKSAGNIIDFYYDRAEQHANVTINYVDAAGNQLSPSDTLSDQVVGTMASATAKNIDGYTVDQATKTANVTDSGATITFVYTKNAPAQSTVTIHFVDENGNKLDNDLTLTGTTGDNFSFAAPSEINGYDLVGDSSINGMYTAGGSDITVKYAKHVYANQDMATVANDILQMVNDLRAQHGLSAVTMDNATLQAIAQTRANETFTEGKEDISAASHTRPDGTQWYTAYTEAGYQGSAIAENLNIDKIGATEAETASIIFNDWKNSAGHLANMLDASANQIGIAIVENPDNGYTYAIQDFGYVKPEVTKNPDGSVNYSEYGLTEADIDAQVEARLKGMGWSYQPGSVKIQPKIWNGMEAANDSAYFDPDFVNYYYNAGVSGSDYGQGEVAITDKNGNMLGFMEVQWLK
ncbi:MucBP domain-containing protein [Furfurilactobacillus curtus]|uniref:LysM domain-containing protein n=1 Tax=Furfurilactobacillus curtus TaxID=1746200 RepID=A0ABQ5JR60_9LACO